MMNEIKEGRRISGSKSLRLLYLAYAFPPSAAIGAVRAWNTARYLSDLGWEVTVVTPRVASDPENARIKEVEAKIGAAGIVRILVDRRSVSAERLTSLPPSKWVLRQSTRALQRFFSFVGIGHDEAWCFSCAAACSNVARQDFDLVLATGSPFCSFLVARSLAKRLRLPFVLDYRDPWSLSAFNLKRVRWLTHFLEKSVLRGATAAIIVSRSWAKNQEKTFGNWASTKVITNGFDPTELSAISPVIFDDFSVVYAGSFYKGQREIDSVIEAVRVANQGLNRMGRRVKLHYFGGGEAHVMERAEQINALEDVVVHGVVPRETVLGAIKGAGVAAVIAGIGENVGLSERGITTGKIFEPLGLGVPILLVAPHQSDARTIVQECGAGRCFATGEEIEMGKWLSELAIVQGDNRYEAPKEYGWPEIAKKLDVILRGSINGSTGGVDA
jgi:Glycosyl transferase 4-like domain